MLRTSVFFRCHTVNFLEVGVEHRLVVHSYPVYDFLDGEVGGEDEIGGV